MKTILKLSLVTITTLAANITFANDGHIQKKKIEKVYFLNESACMATALTQVTQVTNYAYQQMLNCGATPDCTVMYNTLCNQGFSYVENSYLACVGGGNALTSDKPLFSIKK
jgi:hypothetical protein